MSHKSDDEISARAQAYWTKEREAKLTGGKNLIVLPSNAPKLLRTLGLMNSDSSISADKVRKYLQINHMLNLVAPQLDDLAARHKIVRVLDACCGTSFLALITAWFLRENRQTNCEIIGIDANANVITTSIKRTEQLGYTDFVKFKTGLLSPVSWEEAYREQFPGDGSEAPRPHLVLALHACDTATDQALALAVQLNADVIAAAPCCHAELAARWKSIDDQTHPFAPLFHTPNLRRETAAQITDTMRLLLLRSRGYEVKATEFIESIHTPKNRLLLATRRGRYLKQASDQYDALKKSLADQGISLETLLPALPH